MINNPKDFFQQIQNLSEEVALKIKAIGENLASYLTKGEAEKYLEKTEAANTYLGKNETVSRANMADFAMTADNAVNDASGNEITATYLSSTTAASTYLTKSDAQATYLGKDAKAQSATFADSATTASSANSALKATQDGDGNVISGTYLKSETAQSTYLSKTDASSTYLGKTAKAASATTADSATKATQDGNGANIASTYVKTVNGVAPVNGNVEIEVASSGGGGIPATGNRGELAGYEAPVYSDEPVWHTITKDSPDTIRAGGASGCNVVVQAGEAGTSWTKTIFLRESYIYVGGGVRISLGNGWMWANDDIPVVDNNSLLVLHWCNDVGVASMVSGTPIKAGVGTLTFDNPDNVLSAYIVPKGSEGQTEDWAIYGVFGTGTTECQIAVGDLVQVDGGFRTSMVTTSKGITLDSNGYVTDVNDGFLLVLYDED